MAGTAEVYLHEMPGGQYTNLKEQAESMGLGERWHEIARTYAEVNMAFGDIVKVTPSSKVVGDMAIFLVSHGMTIAEFESMPTRSQSDAPELGGRDVLRVAGRTGRRLAAKDCKRVILRGGSRKAAGRAEHAGARRSWSSTDPNSKRKLAARHAQRRDQLSDVSRGVHQVRAARGQSTATSRCCRRPSFSTAWRRAKRSRSNWKPARR